MCCALNNYESKYFGVGQIGSKSESPKFQDLIGLCRDSIGVRRECRRQCQSVSELGATCSRGQGELVKVQELESEGLRSLTKVRMKTCSQRDLIFKLRRTSVHGGVFILNKRVSCKNRFVNDS